MVVQELVARLGIRLDKSSINSANSRLTSVANNARNNIQKSWGTIAGLIGGGALVGSSVRLAASIEGTTMSMQGFLGSAQAATNLVGDLQKMAKENPLFGFTQLAQQAKESLAFGMGVDEVKQNMQLLSDVAAGTGQDIGAIGFNLNQIKSLGAANMIDLRQFAMRGIPIFKALQEQMGLSSEELGKAISDRKITYDEVIRAFRRMTSEGGIFFKATENRAKTTEGAIAAFQDQIELTKMEFGAMVIKSFDLNENLKKLTNGMGKFSEKASAMPEWVKNLAAWSTAGVAGVAALNVVLNITKYLFAGIGLKALGFLKILSKIKGLGSGIADLIFGKRLPFLASKGMTVRVGGGLLSKAATAAPTLSRFAPGIGTAFSAGLLATDIAAWQIENAPLLKASREDYKRYGGRMTRAEMAQKNITVNYNHVGQIKADDIENFRKNVAQAASDVLQDQYQYSMSGAY